MTDESVVVLCFYNYDVIGNFKYTVQCIHRDATEGMYHSVVRTMRRFVDTVQG